MLRSAFSSRRRRRLADGLALVLVAGVVVGVVLSAGSGSPKPATSSRSTSGATAVERRDLVETDTESGTLGYANPQTVYDRLSGTISWLPSVGRVIKPGQTLFEVDGEPVILMNGTRPAYRALSASNTAGQDILQLNRNLVDLGFNPDGIVADDEWQAATTAGVDLLQASLGETETGSLPLGQIVFLPGDQLISTVNATVGSTSGSAGSPASSASTPAAAASTEFVSLTSTGTASPSQSTTPASTTTTPKTTKPKKTKRTKPTWRRKPASSSSSQTLQGLTALLKAEAAQLKAATAALKAAKSSTPSSGQSSSSKSSSSSSKSSNNSSSGSGGSASAILQTNSTQLTVTVDLDATKQSEAKVGENVTVEMPAGNTVDGKVTAVSSVAQSSSGSVSGAGPAAGGSGSSGVAGGSSSSTVSVTIKLKGHQRGAGLDQASVSVNFAQAKARNVLSVPVTALLATSGGRYEVQEATAPYKLIPVTTGLFAAGYVQISGAGIHTGLQVTDSQG